MQISYVHTFAMCPLLLLGAFKNQRVMVILHTGSQVF